MKDKHSVFKTALNNRASRCKKGENHLSWQEHCSAKIQLFIISSLRTVTRKKVSFISKTEIYPTGSNANIYFPKPFLDWSPYPFL